MILSKILTAVQRKGQRNTMSSPTDQSQVSEVKPTDKELNFRALETKYQRQLEQERAGRLEAERVAQEIMSKKNNHVEDEDDDSEPYVDKKKLNKTMAKFSEQTKQVTQSEIQKAVQIAQQEARKEAWLENNPDFYDTLQNHAETLAKRSPALANSILAMPDGFERQKLVYQSIKELGLNKPEQKQPSIQEKIDSNRRSPFYQPSGLGTSPYSNASDFSASGQKNAYDKMKELQARLRG